ncbi:sugar-binding transcriptional regulator [Paenibacillus senegalensis]|uniref:sugar-binding transcriptional regulator n=1 Tax=Paenibacillus senegalensis TaxID=1465766 RepID=UPI0012FCEC0A|nr:sugar-binding domain-containing protein [Paenibacillus senegalensis]
MYYILGYNQQEIAEQLDVGRSSVARFLNEAREQGVVQFFVSSDFESWRNHSLETKLVNQTHLKECVIFKTNPSGSTFEMMAAKYLNTVLPSTGAIGLGWGRTLHAVGTQMHSCDARPDLSVVQLSGGWGAKEELVPATSNIQLWSTALHARPLYLPAPAIVATVESKKSILGDPSVKEVLDRMSQLKAAVIGIGHTGPDATINYTNLAPDLNRSFLESRSVGDVIFHFYDENGTFSFPELSDRVIGATAEDFLNIDLRIGIAKGGEKKKAILGAIRGELVHVLITTEDTAQQLLDLEA